MSELLIDENGKPYKINRQGRKVDLSEVPEFGGCPDGEWMTMKEFNKKHEQEDREYEEYLEYRKQGKIVEEGDDYYIIEDDDEEEPMVADNQPD
jgi:hypothetical protein